MIITEDHLGHPFSLDKAPQRIISMVPSITELLHDLGLTDKIVGRTKFCVFPEGGFPNASIIGGTKNVKVDKVRELKPDLVIANKEESVKEQVEEISTFTQTFTTVVRDRKEALKMISDLGIITHTEAKSNEMIASFKALFQEEIKPSPVKIAYLIWKDPYMTVGGDTFISNYLKDYGLINIFEENTRYPAVTLEQIKAENPDCILLSSEPFPFKDSHQKLILEATGIKTLLIDGSYCSWYGSRMLKSVDYLRQMSNKLG